MLLKPKPKLTITYDWMNDIIDKFDADKTAEGTVEPILTLPSAKIEQVDPNYHNKLVEGKIYNPLCDMYEEYKIDPIWGSKVIDMIVSGRVRYHDGHLLYGLNKIVELCMGIKHKGQCTICKGDSLELTKDNWYYGNYSQMRKHISRNIKPGKSSIYPGVSWSKEKNKWRTNIRINKKLKHIGWFIKEDEKKAAGAYRKAYKKHHGIDLLGKFTPERLIKEKKTDIVCTAKRITHNKGTFRIRFNLEDGEGFTIWTIRNKDILKVLSNIINKEITEDNYNEIDLKPYKFIIDIERNEWKNKVYYDATNIKEVGKKDSCPQEKR